MTTLQIDFLRIAFLVVVITLWGFLTPDRADAQQAVGVVTAVTGDAQRTRGPAQKPLAFRDDVILRDIVATQERSLARILFGGSSTVTVRELSTLEVTEEVLPGGAKRTVYDMSTGAILVRVINKLLGPGDEVQIKTPNAIAAVRGTTVFTRCPASGAQARRCTFSVLAGTLTLTPFGRPPLTLAQNTSVSITGDTASGTQVSPVTPLTTAEAQRILAESDVRTTLETDGVESGIAARELQQATQLASTLVDSVIPPIPTARELQNTSVPSDTEQTQAPVVAGGQGQAVEEAAGPSFPITDFPANIVNEEDLELPPDTNLANVEGSFDDPFLLNVIDSNIAGDTDAIIVGNADVNGIVNSDPSTLTFAGNYLLVTGSATAAGPQSADVAGTFDIGGSFLNIAEGGSLNSSAAAALQFDQSVVTTGNSLIFIDGTASLSGSLLDASDSDFQNIGGDFLEVAGSLSATSSGSPLLTIDPTNVVTAGNFIGVASDSSLATEGQILTDADGTYAIGEDFVHVAGHLNSTSSAPALELSGTTLSTGDDFISVAAGAAFNLESSLLDATDSDFAGIAGDFLDISGALTSQGAAGLLLIDPTTVNTDGSFLAVNAGGSVALDGQLLVDTDGTYDIGESYVSLAGTLESSTELPLIDLNGTTITTGDDFINVSGGSLSTQGDVLELDGGASIAPAGSLLELDGGTVSGDTILVLQSPLTTSGTEPLFDVTAGTLTSGSLTLLGANLTLHQSLLSQSGGSIAVGTGVSPADALAVGANNLTTVAPPGEQAAAPVFDLSGGALDVSRHLVSLGGGGADLGGPLLATSGDPIVNIAGDLLHIASDVNGPGTGSLFDISGGVISGTNLLFLAPESTLDLRGPILDLSGGTIAVTNVLNLQAPVTGPEAPLLSVSGGTLNATEALLILGADLDLAGPVLMQTGGDIEAGTAINVAGGNLGGAGEGLFDLQGGTLTITQSFLNVTSGGVVTEGDLFAIDGALPFTLNGSLLSQNGGTVEADNIIQVLTAFTPATDAPLLDVSDGSLTAHDSLLVLGEGADLDLQGPVVSQTGGVITADNAVTVAGGSLTDNGLGFFDLLGGTFTVQESLLNVTSGSVAAEGDLFTIDGALPFALNGSLLSQSGGTVEAENILNVQAAFAPPTAAPLLQVDDGTLTANASLLVLGADLDLLGPVLAQTGGNITVGTAIRVVGGGDLTGDGTGFFELTGGTFTIQNNLLNVAGGSVSTEGDLFTLDEALPFTLNGSLLAQSGGTVSVNNLLNLQAIFSTSPGVPFLNIEGGNLNTTTSLALLTDDLTLQNSFLAQAGGTIDAGGPVLDVGATTLTSGLSPVFDLAGGTLMGGADLVNVEGGNIALGGPLLSLSGDSIVTLGDDVLDLDSTLTGPASGPVFSFAGGGLSADELADVSFGSDLILDGPLLTMIGGNVSVDNVLNLANDLTTSAATPFLEVVDGLLNTTGALALLNEDSEPFTLTLQNSLLSQSGGIINVGNVELPADALAIGANTVDSTATTEPVFRFEGGFLSGSGHLVSLDGGELSLGGPIAVLSGEVEIPPVVSFVGDALHIASTVTGPSGDPLFLVEHGVLTSDDLLELTNESTLNLTDRLLEVRGDGTVQVLNDVLNLGANLTTPDGPPLIHVSEDATLLAVGSLVDMGADLTLGNSLLSQSGGVVVTVDDALKVGQNTLTSGPAPVFLISGGNYAVPQFETAMVSVDGGVLDLGSPIAVVNNGAAVDLASGFLSAANATVDALGVEESPQDLLVVEGAGTTLSTSQTDSLFSFNPSTVFGNNLLSVTTGATLDLAGALVTDVGSDFFLQNGTIVSGPGSSLSGTHLDALFQTEGSSFVIGGEESGVPIPGDFFGLHSGATASITGPLLDDSGSTFVIIGRLLGIDVASTFTSTGLDPLIQLNASNLALSEDIVQVNSDESLSLAGGLLAAESSSIDAGISVLGINAGTVSATGVNPLLSFTNTIVETQEFDIVSVFGGSLSLEGPLVIADNSELLLDDSILFTDEAALNGTGNAPLIQILNESTVANNELPLIDLGEGEINLAGPLARFEDSTVASQEEILSVEGTDVTGTSPNPFLQFVSSIASSLEAFIGIDSSEESVNLAGPLGRFENSEITADAELVNVVGSTVTGTSPDAFLEFLNTTVMTEDTVFRVDASTLELTGPLVSADNTTFAVAEAPVPPDTPVPVQTEELFLGVGADAALTSATSEPLITLSGDNEEVAALNANALAAVFDNSTVELAGPLATSDSDINVNAVLGVGFDSSLSSTSTEPLLQFSQGTVNAFGAFTVIFGNASLDLAGPLAAISDTPGSINAGRFLFVSEFSDVTSTSPDPFIAVTNATIHTEDFTLFDNEAAVELGGPFVDASNSTFVVGLANPSRFLAVQDGARLFGPRKGLEGDAPALIDLAGETTVTSGLGELGVSHFVDVRRTGAEEPSLLDLEGPLLTISESEITTRADFVRVTQLGELTSTAETALIQSDNASFNIGVDLIEADPAQDNFFRVDNFSGEEIAGAATVDLAGPLLDDVGSTFHVAQDFLRVGGESMFTSTTGDPLIRLSGSDVSTADRFVLVISDTETPSTLALDGPLLHASDTMFQIDTNEDINAFVVINGGALSGTTSEPLITLDTGTQVSGSTFFYRVRSGGTTDLAGPLVHDSGSTIDTDRFLRVQEDSSLVSTATNALIHLDGSTVDTGNDFTQIIDELSRVEVSAPLVHTQGSTIDAGTNSVAAGDFLQIAGGAQLAVNTDGPILLFDGGTITVGTNDGTSDDSPNHLVRLQGRALEVGMDQPVIGDGTNPPPFEGAASPVGSLVEARGGAEISVERGEGDTSGGNAIRLDRALLEASLPIINLIGGEEALTTLTTANHAILANDSQIVNLGPLVALDRSVINVTNGALLTLTNGSHVDVQGDLLKLINASRINIVNGPLIRADAASVLDVTGALVNFGGTGGNILEVNNSIPVTDTTLGIPYHTANGGTVSIQGTPVVNPNLGSISINPGNPMEGQGALIQSLNESAVNIGLE